MKVSHSIAALVAPAMVLAAPIEKYRAGQNEGDVKGLISSPITAGTIGPLPQETGPGPVIPADNLPEVIESETRPLKEEKRSDDTLLSLSDMTVTTMHCTDFEDPDSCEIWTGIGGQDADELLDLLDKVDQGTSKQSVNAIIENARERHGDEYADWLRRLSGGSEDDTTGQTRKAEKRSEDVTLERPDSIMSAPLRLPSSDVEWNKLHDWLNKTNPNIYERHADAMRYMQEDARRKYEGCYDELLRSTAGENKGETEAVDYYCFLFSGTQ